MEVDPVLAPSAAAIHQDILLTEQRVKRVCDADDLLCFCLIPCS